MLVLRSSPASPFGRKVKMAALELGLMDKIEIVAADTTDPNEVLREQNPLGKIPTLVLEDGVTLFGKIIPAGEARFAQLRLQALADGIADAALLKVYEGRFRAETERSANWVAHQDGKVARGLAALEAAPPAFPDRPRIGEIALACALGYLDLRFAGA